MNIGERIYRNVKALARLNELKLGDIEGKIGVSRGYLSRKKALVVDKVCMVADVFGVTTDDLIRKDYEKEYKKQFAIYDLRDAIVQAKQKLSGAEILDIVNGVLEEG